jgi:hypothetical protein
MTTNKKENIIMAKNTTIDLSTLDLDAILDVLADKVAARLNGQKGSVPKDEDDAPAPKRGRGKAKAEEPEDEDDEEGADDERLAELMKKRITTLRKEALALGFDDDEVAEADKETLVESIMEAEKEEGGSDDEDEEPEDDDADEDEADEDEEGDYDRDELEELTLPALKKMAKEAGFSTADLKGLDKDAIIDALMGEDEEADDDEEDEDEEGWYEEDELAEMSLADLKKICKDNEIPVKRGAKQDDLIEAILEAGEEEE